MKKWLIRNLGMKGSWKWACKQMKCGLAVRPSTATGTVRYMLDCELQQRICWAFVEEVNEDTKWESAKLFLKDFDSTEWVVV